MNQLFVGQRAPDFKLDAAVGKGDFASVSLADHRGKWVVLFFYQLDFIIGPEGVVQYALYHNTNVGRSVGETLRVLEALQTGERCPVEWKKGEKTLGK